MFEEVASCVFGEFFQTFVVPELFIPVPVTTPVEKVYVVPEGAEGAPAVVFS